MKFVADLHLHSRYSRAVSQDMVLPKMAEYAKYKGISVLAASDFTHPFWFEKLKDELSDVGNGLYRLKQNGKDVYFLLSTEISSIYSQGGKGRRIHNLFFFPSISSVEKFNSLLIKKGANLRSDGRPIVGISSRNLAEMALEVDEKVLIIPAHVWTPWFSLFGSFSGFDSVEECFGDMAKYIYGIETGLSSDPLMNWQISDLSERAILSFSDAHSLSKMGREATIFEGKEVSYGTIYDAVTGKKGSKVAFTIEFYPEEGKYHFTGHRNCNWSQGPEKAKETVCPVCKRPLTVGVMDRVEELKSQDSKIRPEIVEGVKWNFNKDGRPPYVSMVPLVEILSEAFGGAGVSTKTVTDPYSTLVSTFGSEFNVLLKAKLEDIAKTMPGKIVTAIEKVRTGNINVIPGFDGNYGIVKIFEETKEVFQNEAKTEEEAGTSQLNLFAP